MISGMSINPLPSPSFKRCSLYWRTEWSFETLGLCARPRIVFCWMREHCHDLQDKFCCSCSVVNICLLGYNQNFLWQYSMVQHISTFIDSNALDECFECRTQGKK
jgi:hypothetical protein